MVNLSLEEVSIVPLKDVVKRVKVGFVGSCNDDYCSSEEGVPMIRTTNLTKEGVKLENLKYINKEFHDNHVKSQIKYGDILIARHGHNGLASLWEYNFDAQSLNVVIVETDDSLADKYYLTYLINSPLIQKQIKSLTGGSVQSVVNTKDIADLLIPVPPLSKQNEIAYLISLFNKKIEANKSINKNLQILSKSLLKYYLEDFEPYLENGVKSSEIGDIPKDWVIYEFDSISNIYNGYSYKSNELQPSNSAMVTIKNFNRDGSFRTDGFKEIIYSDKVKDYHFVNENDVLISCTDVTQDADIIGNCVILLDKMKYDDLIMSMDLVKIESKKEEINNFLLASILKSYRFKMHILGYVNGTTVLHLDKKGIKKFKLALPNDLSILKDLNDILESIYKQIAVNQKEINSLQKLRDTLLPKLMSGEIDVSKINCDL